MAETSQLLALQLGQLNAMIARVQSSPENYGPGVSPTNPVNYNGQLLTSPEQYRSAYLSDLQSQASQLQSRINAAKQYEAGPGYAAEQRGFAEQQYAQQNKQLSLITGQPVDVRYQNPYAFQTESGATIIAPQGAAQAQAIAAGLKSAPVNPAPTSTEMVLKESLPAGIRELSPSEVAARTEYSLAGFQPMGVGPVSPAGQGLLIGQKGKAVVASNQDLLPPNLSTSKGPAFVTPPVFSNAPASEPLLSPSPNPLPQGVPGGGVGNPPDLVQQAYATQFQTQAGRNLAVYGLAGGFAAGSAETLGRTTVFAQQFGLNPVETFVSVPAGAAQFLISRPVVLFEETKAGNLAGAGYVLGEVATFGLLGKAVEAPARGLTSGTFGTAEGIANVGRYLRGSEEVTLKGYFEGGVKDIGGAFGEGFARGARGEPYVSEIEANTRPVSGIRLVTESTISPSGLQITSGEKLVYGQTGVYPGAPSPSLQGNYGSVTTSEVQTKTGDVLVSGKTVEQGTATLSPSAGQEVSFPVVSTPGLSESIFANQPGTSTSLPFQFIGAGGEIEFNALRTSTYFAEGAKFFSREGQAIPREPLQAQFTPKGELVVRQAGVTPEATLEKVTVRNVDLLTTQTKFGEAGDIGLREGAGSVGQKVVGFEENFRAFKQSPDFAKTLFGEPEARIVSKTVRVFEFTRPLAAVRALKTFREVGMKPFASEEPTVEVQPTEGGTAIEVKAKQEGGFTTSQRVNTEAFAKELEIGVEKTRVSLVEKNAPGKADVFAAATTSQSKTASRAFVGTIPAVLISVTGTTTGTSTKTQPFTLGETRESAVTRFSSVTQTETRSKTLDITRTLDLTQQRQQQLELQRQQQLQQERFLTGGGIGNPLPPVEPRTNLLFSSSEPSGKKKNLTRVFKTLVRRKRQFKEVGQPRPYGEALSLGQQIVLGTLARTFRLEPAGVAEVEETPSPSLGNKFREPRSRELRAPLTFVQKAQFSLSSLGEKLEIQKSRRNKR